MRQEITLLLAFGLSQMISTAIAQTKHVFDIVEHVPPAGWKSERTSSAVSWSTSNTQTGGWCRMTLYRSTPSRGNPVSDFREEWNTLVAANNPVKGEPQPQQSNGSGWTLTYGESNFMFNSQKSLAALYTFSGYGLRVSLVYLSNTKEFAPAFERLWESIDLQEPTAQVQTQPRKESGPDQPPATGSGTATKTSAIGYSTTNFDDGWTSTIHANSVQVVKGQTRVALHHGIVLNDELRQGDLSENLFKRLIPAAYQVSNFRKVNLQEGCMFLCEYYLAADVVEIASGRQGFLAFAVATTTGVSRCIEIFTPSAEIFRSEFPDPGRLSVMLYYNRFAITLADITGSWKGGSSAAMDMYYTGTGTYAGMNTAVLSDEFVFKRDGTYTSRHTGAVGMVGNMSFSDNKYSGQLQAGLWDLSLSKRFEGKTDVFNVWFEAVQGGFVLHLQNKEASGIKFDLVRVP